MLQFCPLLCLTNDHILDQIDSKCYQIILRLRHSQFPKFVFYQTESLDQLLQFAHRIHYEYFEIQNLIFAAILEEIKNRIDCNSSVHFLGNHRSDNAWPRVRLSTMCVICNRFPFPQLYKVNLVALRETLLYFESLFEQTL